MLSFRKETSYAIQLVRYLSEQPGECCSLKKFSDQSKISFFFLQKIARKLVKKNIIQAEHGVCGGYTLRKETQNLSLFDIVEIMENGVLLLPCVKGIKFCRKKSPECKVRDIITELNKEIIKLMKKIKIISK
ncbi:MAG: Rrf2 family transcriptional regulator [bacterium]